MSAPALVIARRFTESQRIIRERHFFGADLDEIISMLHASRASGALSIQFDRGSIRSLSFKEEHSIDPNPR